MICGRGVMGACGNHDAKPACFPYSACSLERACSPSRAFSSHLRKDAGTEQAKRSKGVFWWHSGWPVAFCGLLHLTVCFCKPVTEFLGRNDTMGQLCRQYGRVLVTGAPVFPVFGGLLQAFVRNNRRHESEWQSCPAV